MPVLSDIVGYLCEHYPYSDELSKARLTKLVYLADWRNSIRHSQQLTDLNWVYNKYGPYVDDVVNSVRYDPSFEIKQTQNAMGDFKELVSLTSRRDWPSLDEEDRRVLDHVIESTKQRNWKDFIKLVYSTYPVVVRDKGDSLNLPVLAAQYRALLDLIDRSKRQSA